MKIAIINFLIGAFGALAIFLITTFLSAEKKFSAPFFVVAIGIVCAMLSTVFGFGSTLAILGIYIVLGAREHYLDFKE